MATLILWGARVVSIFATECPSFARRSRLPLPTDRVTGQWQARKSSPICLKDARSDECLIPFARLGAMVCFDYKAPTELFATRKRLPRRQPLGYKRFAQAADAIRFAMEEVPRECLAGAFLEVDGERYGGEDIRRLYESAEYPLARRAAHS
jgi:hypothetical protein